MIQAAFVLPHPPLIIHSVGRGREREIQTTINSYIECAKSIAKIKPETIVITSPHALCYADYFHISSGKNAYGSFAQFGAPTEKFFVEYDEELVEKICALCKDKKIDAGAQGKRENFCTLDHGTMVPLYFINQFFRKYKLVRIGLSGLSLKEHWKLGNAISCAIEALNKNCVFIASGDLSHKLKNDGPYGFDKAGPAYDEQIMKDLSAKNFASLLNYDEDFIERAAQCGHRSFVIMGGALAQEDEHRSNIESKSNLKNSFFHNNENANSKNQAQQKICSLQTYIAKMFSYEGPFGVGYGVCAYFAKI